jgi:hypothetical protein
MTAVREWQEPLSPPKADRGGGIQPSHKLLPNGRREIGTPGACLRG